ncbi:hypothetical protein [Ensifer sp. MJa1]|uniref:hypothetical protein n=1 Tax=Ensifer sp. MJa1 TaxID=2919888 RepID=UPI003009CD44
MTIALRGQNAWRVVGLFPNGKTRDAGFDPSEAAVLETSERCCGEAVISMFRRSSGPSVSRPYPDLSLRRIPIL